MGCRCRLGGTLASVGAPTATPWLTPTHSRLPLTAGLVRIAASLCGCFAACAVLTPLARCADVNIVNPTIRGFMLLPLAKQYGLSTSEEYNTLVARAAVNWIIRHRSIATAGDCRASLPMCKALVAHLSADAMRARMEKLGVDIMCLTTKKSVNAEQRRRVDEFIAVAYSALTPVDACASMPEANLRRLLQRLGVDDSACTNRRELESMYT